MLERLRTARPSAATALSFLALMVALSGTAVGETAVAAAKKLIGSKEIRNGSITGADVKNDSIAGADLKAGSINSDDVKDRSLRARDFRSGELPAGPQGATGEPGARGAVGPAGPTGPTGAKGDPGTVDTSKFYDKAASDARFLGIGAKAADAGLLDGNDSTAFVASAKTLWASVNANGSAARIHGFATAFHAANSCDDVGGTDSKCTGTYFLQMPDGIASDRCTYTATVGRVGLIIGSQAAQSTPGIATVSPHSLPDPNYALVTTRTMDGVPADLPFHVIALCN